MNQLSFDTESQNKTVLKHLVKYGSITANEAIRLYSIQRLSARIYDLKDKGVRIGSEIQFNPINKSIHWSKYSLIVNYHAKD
jgi:hypothetical protein